MRLALVILCAAALLGAAPQLGAPTASAARRTRQPALAVGSLRDPTSAQAAVRLIEAEGESAKYWPRWRGPSGQGVVGTGRYPDTWSPTDGVKWKVPVPGRGNSSPIVWRDRIYFTTAYEGGVKLSLLCYSRSDGKLLWELVAPQEGVERAHR